MTRRGVADDETAWPREGRPTRRELDTARPCPGSRRDATHTTDPTRTWTGPLGPVVEEADASRSRSRGGTSPRHVAPRWIGWRFRLLVACALVGSIGLFALIGAIASAPTLAAGWVADDDGRPVLVSTHDPLLIPFLGRALVGVVGATPADALLHPSDLAIQARPTRWIVDDAERARHIESKRRWWAALASGTARLVFEGGEQVVMRLMPSPLGSLPLIVWPLAGFALALYLISMTVVLAHPCAQNLAYVAMALPQAASLVLLAIDRALPFGLTAEALRWTPTLQIALDWTTAAAMVHAACLHPHRLPHGRAIAVLAWGTVATLAALAFAGRLPQLWIWAQASITGLGIATLLLFSWSHRLEPHPFSFALRRFGLVMLTTWTVLSLVVLSADRHPALEEIAVTGPVTWALFLAALLLLVPALARSQDFLREFALLALVSAVATLLDLVFVIVFALGQVTSLALALFAALAVYTGARQWILDRLVGENLFTTERMFEQLYRTAREVEKRPERAPALLSDLMVDLFDPLEIGRIDRALSRVRVGGGGSTLHVPVPLLEPDADARGASTLVLRYARRGRRLFADDDARLASRVVEQLRRAVRFDRAVEQGRSEERLRIAQDLHDDIGARLLTLMYQAPNKDMEDYARHTLQDLKTLTRGLAEGSHRLSHAIAEWKADLAQRTGAAGLALDWRAVVDDAQDVSLTVVQWSALTRILRELVTNAIAHARATSVTVELRFDGDAFALRVADDGCGGDPREWSHGLGLGGVRKRVKQLGGTVEWHRAAPSGIECRVRVDGLGEARTADPA